MNSNLQQKQEIQEHSYFSGLSSQQDFEIEMAQELPMFLQIQEKALEMMKNDLSQKHPSYQNRNSKANRMNENIKGLLFGEFPDEMKETISQRFYFEKRNKYIVLFKKLDRRFFPMNISTKSVKKILSQLSLDFPQIPIVFVGYVPNRSWEELKHVCAVYISNREVIWVSDLRRFDRGITSLDLFSSGIVEDTSNQISEEEFILVRPKKKQDKNETTNN